MPTIELPSRLKIHYLDPNPTGKKTVLLFHGLGATCDSWQLQIPALTEAGLRVLAPDARGFGSSDYPGGGVSIPTLAADMASLLDALLADGQRVSVVGISMGGTLALQLALDRPDRPDKLALVNTFARLRPKSLRVWSFYLLRFFLVHTVGISTQARIVAGRLFPHPDQILLRQAFTEQILQADPRGYRAALRALARFNVTGRLKEIQVPALVVTGERDTTVSIETQAKLASGLPKARQVVIPEAGHAVTVEKPEVFNRLLIEFLNG
jgi:pimeloyl-ACP methyl ester carboxylesterase